VHVIVDTPAGSANKYQLDPSYGTFRVSRKLPDGMVFPHDFGSVPGTRAADGDPLDVLVVGLQATFPGCLVTVRLLGMLHAYQLERGKKVRNDLLIGAAETPVNRALWRRLRDLPPSLLRDIEHFFEAYNAAQARPFRITGRSGRESAERAVNRAVRAFGANSKPS
jgi:inorganic pyrophosphatase